MGRNIVMLRRLAKHLVWSSRLECGSGRLKRKILIGSPQEKAQAVRRTENLLALCQSWIDGTGCKTPPSLNPMVAALRKTAGDCRMSASGRVIALSRLALIAGLPVACYWDLEPLDELIISSTGRKYARATKPESTAPTAVNKRQMSRNRAVWDIKATLKADADAGRIKSVSDAIQFLRLPEQPFAGEENTHDYAAMVEQLKQMEGK